MSTRDRLAVVLALVALGASASLDAALDPRARVRQSVKVESVVTPGARPPAAAVVEAPLPPPRVMRRVELTPEAERVSTATVKDRITREIGAQAGDAVVLPGAVSVPLEGGGLAEIRHVVMPGERLVYDPASGEFTGSIRVGAVVGAGAAPPALPDPVTFQVIDAGTEQGATIVVKSLAPPFEPIAVKVRNPSPPVTLRVASGSDQPMQEIVLPIEPTLFVLPVSRTVRGDGLGQTEIQVQAIADRLLPGQAVLLSAEPAADLSPSRVVLGADGTGVATLKSVDTGVVTITARAAGFQQGSTTVEFAAVARRLAVSRSSEVIQGYGVGVTTLTITATAPDLRPQQAVSIDVSPAGHLDRRQYVLGEGGRIDVLLQSEGTGTATITVTAPGFEPATTTVEYAPPVETVTAALLGGLVGGGGRLLARPSRRRKWSTVASSLVLSAIVAAIAYALFRIGVNVFPVAPTVTTGAVAVFALAALAGFIGASLLPGGRTAESAAPEGRPQDA